MNKLYLIVITSLFFTTTTKTMEDDDWTFIEIPKTSQSTPPAKRVTAAELKKILLEKEQEIKQLAADLEKETQEKNKLSQENTTINSQLRALQQAYEILQQETKNKDSEILRLTAATTIAESFTHKQEENQHKSEHKRNKFLEALKCCLPIISSRSSEENFVDLDDKLQ